MIVELSWGDFAIHYLDVAYAGRPQPGETAVHWHIAKPTRSSAARM